MDPERWSQITGTYSVVRGEKLEKQPIGYDSNSISKKVEVKDGKARNNLCQDNRASESKMYVEHSIREIAANLDSLNGENVKIINTLKAIIKEKAEKIRHQEEIIVALQQKIVENIENSHSHTSNEACTQVGPVYLRESLASPPGHIVKSSTVPGVISNEKELELVHAKMEGLEKRFDVLLTFIQKQFPKFPNGSSNGTLNGTTVKVPGTFTSKVKPWNKPPTLKSKPTSSSILREVYCRNRNLAGGVGNAMSLGNVYDNEHDYCCPVPEDIEERLQFLESLVAQLKMKFWKIISQQRKK